MTIAEQTARCSVSGSHRFARAVGRDDITASSCSPGLGLPKPASESCSGRTDRRTHWQGPCSFHGILHPTPAPHQGAAWLPMLLWLHPPFATLSRLPRPVPPARRKDPAKPTQIAAQRHLVPNNPVPPPPPAPCLCPSRETSRKMKIKLP